MECVLDESRSSSLVENPNDSRLFLYTTQDGWSWQLAQNPRFLDWIEMGVPAMKTLNGEN